ncbi:FUSC family protein [Gordonia terrae]
MLRRDGVDESLREELHAASRAVGRLRPPASAADLGRRASPAAGSGRFAAILRALHPNSAYLPGATRTFVGALIAGSVALALGVGHSYWAAVTAVAVLAVPNAAGSLPRVLQRVVGSMIGVGIAFATLASVSDPIIVAALIILFVTVGEMLVVRNYGYGMVLITPTAMLLTSMAHPNTAAALSADRLADTMIGAVFGVLCALGVPNPRARREVEAALSAARTELHRFAGDRTTEARGRLLHALVVLRESHSTASGEYWTAAVNSDEVSKLEHEGFRAVREANLFDSTRSQPDDTEHRAVSRAHNVDKSYPLDDVTTQEATPT